MNELNQTQTMGSFDFINLLQMKLHETLNPQQKNSAIHKTNHIENRYKNAFQNNGQSLNHGSSIVFPHQKTEQ